MSTATSRLMLRLGQTDRRLYQRYALPSTATSGVRAFWVGLTHLASAFITISAALLPLLLGGAPTPREWRCAAILVSSHLAVRSIKRLVHRDRPSGTPLIPCPDCFSFPSGHATASMAIALGQLGGTAFFPIPLILLAALTGWSRVSLGVHYPADVVMGQIIAVATALAVNLAI